MSGLTCFFRDYLVDDSEKTTTATNSNYHQSLAQATRSRSTTIGIGNDNNNSPRQQHHASSNTTASGHSASSRSTSSRHPNNHNNNNNNLVQAIHEPMDYKTCKLWRREFLQAFLDNRMTRHNNNQDEEEEDDNTIKQHPPKSQQQQAGEPTAPQKEWDTQLETQQELLIPQRELEQQVTDNYQETTAPQHDTTTATSGQQYHPLTPHIDDTLHHVDYLPDLDLMTRTATFLICPCHNDKIWPCRSIHRTKHAVWPRQADNDDGPKLYCSTEQLPLLSMDACQEDGPLSSCYSTVCSLQVSQYNTTLLRQRAERAVLAGGGDHTTTTTTTTASTPRRLWLLNVYFYNQYAAVLDKLMKNYGGCINNTTKTSNQKTSEYYQLVFSFHNIPAKCILPCPARDWYDRMHVSESCLCLGDESSLCIREEPLLDDGNDSASAADDSPPVPVRFDHKDMRIYVGFVKKNNTSTSLSLERDVYCLIPHETAGVMVERVLDQNNPLAGYPPAPPEKTQQEKATITTSTPQPEPEPTTGTLSRPETLCEPPPHVVDLKARPQQIQQPQSTTQPPTPVVHEPLPKRQRHEDQEPHSRKGTATSTNTAAAASQTRRAEPLPQPDCTPPRSDKEQAQQQQPNAQSLPNGQFPQKQKQEIHYETIGALPEVLAQHQALAQADPASSGPCIVNLHGVVIGFSRPTTTKRGDSMMGIALVDETVQLFGNMNNGDDDDAEKVVHTVNINIFTKVKDALPKVLYAGDVLRMHRVKLQQWKDDMQLMGIRASSYVVCRGNVQDPAATTQWTVLSTSQTSQVSQAEQKRMQTLWTWGQKRILSHPTMKPENSFKLGDVMHQESAMMASTQSEIAGGDITVMVSAILPIPEHELTAVSPRGFLRVWDGTGTPDSDPYPLPGVMVGANDPPSSALVQLAALVKRLRFIRQNPDLQPPKVVTGRVVNVAIWEKTHWELVNQAVTVGSFVRLRNVRDDRLPNSGLHCLMVLPNSYLTPLPSFCYEVVQLLEEHNGRLLRKEPENPQSGILPLSYDEQSDNNNGNEREAMDISEPAVSGSPVGQQRPAGQLDSRTFQKLMDLVPAPVDSFFEGTIKVIALIPSMSNLASSGLEHICTIKENDSVHSYCFGVRVRDETDGEIDAIVMDEAVGQKLVGMPAEEALQSSLGALFNLYRMIQEQEARHATIKSIAHLGTKYFVVQSL